MNIANRAGYAAPWRLLAMASYVTDGLPLEFAADAISEMPSSDMYNLASVHYNFVNYDGRGTKNSADAFVRLCAAKFVLGRGPTTLLKNQKLSVRDLTDFV